MCTSIVKVSGETVFVLEDIPCCLKVADVMQVVPEVSLANGWRESGLYFPGMTVVPVILKPAELKQVQRLKPTTVLFYRGQQVHFTNQERIQVTCEYIAARMRRAQDYVGHQAFLENLPPKVLKGTARDRVVKLLQRLLK